MRRGVENEVDRAAVRPDFWSPPASGAWTRREIGGLPGRAKGVWREGSDVVLPVHVKDSGLLEHIERVGLEITGG